MKSKAPLVMIEQMVMLLVFALAAALCMQAFVKSDAISKDSAERDRAVVAVQNAAETARACGAPDGSLEGVASALGVSLEDDGSLCIALDGDWSPAADGAAYLLEVRPVRTDVAGLCGARVSALRASDGEAIFETEVAWQGVTDGAQ